MTSSKRAAAILLDSLKQKNAGKMQFNVVREEIFALLDKGYSRRALHAVLREKGLFTGSYRRFCEYVQGIGNRERGTKTPEPAFAALEKIAPAVPAPTETAPPADPTPPEPRPEKDTPPTAASMPAPTPPTAPQTPRQEKPASSGFVYTTPNHSDLF
ncbi:TraK family protein [Desulfovibrio desulfuricans]|uniref:TraK family protein n=1 Tax=Desulfovibrio desulfuricans TaxID=876 RepID=UPI0035B11D0E